MPDSTFMRTKPQNFSGIVRITDWSDNPIETLKYNLVSNSSNLKTNSLDNCTNGTDWFWCDDIYDWTTCNYLFTTCNDDYQSLNNDFNYGDFGSDSVTVTTPKTFYVGGFAGYWFVDATYLLNGVKFANNPLRNYFTSLPSGNSYIHNLNANLPNATYSQRYAISNWVIGYSGVMCEVKGDVQHTFGYDLVQKPKGYLASTDL